MNEQACLYDPGISCPEDQSIQGWTEKCRVCPILEAIKQGKGCMSIEW